MYSQVTDVDGSPTRWGRWDPPSLNGDPAWSDERGLNSLQILSYIIASHRLATEAGAATIASHHAHTRSDTGRRG